MREMGYVIDASCKTSHHCLSTVNFRDPLPAILEGLLGQCEARQLLHHYQAQGEVCQHQMRLTE